MAAELTNWQTDKQLILDKDHQSVSGNVSLLVRVCVATIKQPTIFFPFPEDAIHLWVWKHCRLQLSKRKSPGGHRETTCYERRLGSPKAAAWTRLKQYPSSGRLDTKHIITSCERFSALLEQMLQKKMKGLSTPPPQQKHVQCKLFPTKAAWQ